MTTITLRLVAALTSVAMLAGCASMGRGQAYRPLVDMQNKAPAQFEADLQQCQSYAKERADAAAGAMVGAVAAGLLGAFLAPRGYKNQVAGKAAGLGALGGASEAGQTQEQVIKRCLAGRGYNVLD